MLRKIKQLKDKIIILVKHTKNKKVVDWGMVIAVVILFAASIVTSSTYNINATSNNKSITASDKKEDNVILTFTGDIMMDRYVSRTYKKNGIDYYFDNIYDFIENSDLVVANIESSLVSDLDGQFIRTNNSIANFGIDEKTILDLENAGISLFSFANNHIGDYGYLGMKDTLKVLEDNNLQSVGVYHNNREKLYYEFSHNGINFAIISALDAQPSIDYSPYVRDNVPGIISSAHQEELLLETINEAKESNDFVIAYMHWGEEYVSTNTTRQDNLAESLIDNGVDLIIGHHPHVLQPITFYKGVPIINSLGNFIFDQVQGDTNLSAVLNVEINPQMEIERLIFRPLEIKNTRPMQTKSGVSRFRIKKRLIPTSRFRSIFDLENGDFILELENNND